MKLVLIIFILFLVSVVDVFAGNKQNNNDTTQNIETIATKPFKTEMLTEILIKDIGSIIVPSHYISERLIINTSTAGLFSSWFADKSKGSIISIQELSVHPKDECDWKNLLWASSKIDIHKDRVWKKHYSDQTKSFYSFDKISQRCSIHSILKLDASFSYVMQGFPCDNLTNHDSFGSIASQQILIPERHKIIDNTEVAIEFISNTFKGEIEIIK